MPKYQEAKYNIIHYLNVATEREIFPERMTLESVIRQNPSQIGVIGEEDTVHVPDFAFVPVGGLEHVVGWFDGSHFVGVGLHANAGVKTKAQEVVDDL